MLRSVTVQNFKALGPRPVEIALGRLTVLVGENGAGKSSVLDAIAILGQSIRERHNRSGLVIEGSLTELTGDSSKEARRRLFFRHDTEKWLAIEATVALDCPPLDQRVQFLGSKHPAFELWPPKSISFGVRTRERFEISEWQQDLKLDSKSFGTWTTRVNPNPRMPPLMEAHLSGLEPMRGGATDRVLSWDLFNSIDASKLDESQQRFLDIGRVAGDIFARHFGDHLSFLSSVRGAPLFQTKTGPITTTVGKHGEESLRILNALSQKGREKVARLEEWAERFGLKQLRGVWRGGDELTVAYVDPHSGTEIDSIVFAGSGSKHVLPVLVALARADAGDTVLLDEPEVSLHPAWLLQLATVLISAAACGVQVVLATQMPTLVLALARGLRSQKEFRDLRIVEVSRDRDGSRATVLELSPRGYLMSWPYSQIDAELLKEVGDGQDTPRNESSRSPGAVRGKSNPRRKRRAGHR